MNAPLDLMIRVRGVTKRFGDQAVLRGLDMDIPRGGTTVVLGRSGCGKSVLLKHFIGLMRADSGRIEVDGEDVSVMSEEDFVRIRRKVGMLFQGAALFDSMSVAGNLAFPLRESGVRDEEEIGFRVREALEMVGLAGEEMKMPDQLSGGMRKRVGLARTIVSRPACILYDEPTTGLDPIATDSINHLIRRLQERLRVTSVVVTHDMRTAFHTADHLVFLHEGTVYAQGSPEEVRGSKDPVLRDFIEGRSREG
jgi:phospholipid/cholesterol/gamma-HCH transport system ATP-binding protein